MSDAIKQDIKLFGDSSDLSLIGNRLKALPPPPLPAGECDHGTNVETTGASIVYSTQWVRPPCTLHHPVHPCSPLPPAAPITNILMIIFSTAFNDARFL